MALWIPITLIAVTIAGVYTQRKPAASPTCANQFTPEQRANLDRFLQTDPRDLLALAASKGFDKSQAVNEIHLNATKLDALGCNDDATRVRAKAAEVSLATLRPTDTRHGVTNQGTPPPPAQPISGAFVAPEVRVGGMEPPAPQPTQHGVAPGTTQRLDQAYGQAFGAPPAVAPPPSPSPVLAVTRTNARVAIRPEPVAWNDEAMGKLGFTVPAGYPIGITAVGPPACPPGWTKVSLQHPDEGSVEGFTEAANLVPPQQANPSQQAAKAPQQAKPAPSTSGMPQSFQGRSRTRTQQQRAKMKANRPSPKPSSPAR